MPDSSTVGSLVQLAAKLPPLSDLALPNTGAGLALAQKLSGRFQCVGERDANSQPLDVERQWMVHLDVDGDEPCQCLSLHGRFPDGKAASLLFDCEPIGGKVGELVFGGALRHAFDPQSLIGAEQMLLCLQDNVSLADGIHVLHLVRNNSITHSLQLERVDGFFRDLAIEIDNLLAPEPKIHAPVLQSIDPLAHPNHPDDLPAETISIASTFARAGLRTKTTGPGNAIAAPEIGVDELWDESELHAAMLAYWAANPVGPGWRLWHGLASTSVFGSQLQGLMFDWKDDLQRQGSATFLQSILSSPPLSELGKPDLQKQSEARRTFWCMVHEMGHGLNLAHSFEKDIGTGWIAVENEPEARSYMNYVRNVDGGEEGFFASFRYLFSPSERLFIRHAPEVFVMPGGAATDSNHGAVGILDDAGNSAVDPALKLRLANRGHDLSPVEPVWLDLAIDRATQPARVDNHDLLVRLRHNGGHWRCWRPGFQLCEGSDHAMARERPVAGRRHWRIPLSASANGWMTLEPGDYDVDVIWKHPAGIRRARPLRFAIAPASRQERPFATPASMDLFARLVAFGGCPPLRKGEALLIRMAERLGDHPAAIHAGLALAAPRCRPFKIARPNRSGRGNIVSHRSDSAAMARRLAPIWSRLEMRGITLERVAAALAVSPTLSVAGRLSLLAEPSTR